MPSDNLENLFREKVEEVQHTPPPQFTWTPEKSWDQLQPLLPAPRRKAKPSFYLGVAAGLVLALLASLFLYRLFESKISTATEVASTSNLPSYPAKKAIERPVDQIEKPHELLATAKPGVTPLAKETKAPISTRKVVTNPPDMGKEKLAAPINQEKEQEPAAQPALLAAAPAAGTQPLKITVVLGAKTLARTETVALETSAVPDTNLLAKEKPNKKKLRLRIHNPDTGLPADTQLATIRPVSSDYGLGTRIKF